MLPDAPRPANVLVVPRVLDNRALRDRDPSADCTLWKDHPLQCATSKYNFLALRHLALEKVAC